MRCDAEQWIAHKPSFGTTRGHWLLTLAETVCAAVGDFFIGRAKEIKTLSRLLSPNLTNGRRCRLMCCIHANGTCS